MVCDCSILIQTAEAKSNGGKIILGGSRVDGTKGYYVQPTIIAGQSRSRTAYLAPNEI
jgi:acyl-CoA reductase-like NAD-dependent aldehyde dehydrogenase